MAWAKHAMIVALAGLGGLIVIGKLGGSGEPKVGAASPMKGAVYASAIPVFPGAKLRDVMGGNYYNDIGGPVTFSSQSWFFEHKAPLADVVAFYRKNLPEGYKTVETEAGEVGFEWAPPGAAEGEDVHVTVREGELQIGETVKAKN